MLLCEQVKAAEPAAIRVHVADRDGARNAFLRFSPRRPIPSASTAPWQASEEMRSPREAPLASIETRPSIVFACKPVRRGAAATTSPALTREKTISAWYTGELDKRARSIPLIVPP